jgi:hypothetical protein
MTDTKLVWVKRLIWWLRYPFNIFYFHPQKQTSKKKKKKKKKKKQKNNDKSNYHRGAPLIGSTPLPHLCVCAKPLPGLEKATRYCLFILLGGLRWEVVVHFVDIGGIVCWSSHCLNLFFAIRKVTNTWKTRYN